MDLPGSTPGSSSRPPFFHKNAMQQRSSSWPDRANLISVQYQSCLCLVEGKSGKFDDRGQFRFCKRLVELVCHGYDESEKGSDLSELSRHDSEFSQYYSVTSIFLFLVTCRTRKDKVCT